MKFNHLFGPVASRRLGVSLGVDLVVHKICSLDCLYCECGKTTQLTSQRRDWVPFDRVKAELDQYFSTNDDPDYITFSGSGEPCLNKDIGRVIAYIKDKKPDIKVAVLTNATLLGDAGVRNELALADLVVPSLDAVSDSVFQKINRPCSTITSEQIILGIQVFTQGFKGRVHLEIFILPGVNDSPEELALFAKAIDRIKPDLVQLNSLDRPGTEQGIQPPSFQRLEQIRQELGPEHVEIIARVPKQSQQRKKVPDLEAAVLETIHRRPCTCEDLASMLGGGERGIQDILDQLEDKGIVISRQESRGRFYQTQKQDSQT